MTSPSTSTSTSTKRAITVAVADEEKERRAACVRVLAADRDIEVVAEAATFAETLSAARFAPRILLVDSKLAIREGLGLLPVFRKNSPRTRVIILAGQSSSVALVKALSLGAHGLLNRRALRALLPKAVRKVDAGELWVSRKMIPRIIENLRDLQSSSERRDRRRG